MTQEGARAEYEAARKRWLAEGQSAQAPYKKALSVYCTAVYTAFLELSPAGREKLYYKTPKKT